MNSIKNYLVKIRQSKILIDLQVAWWKIYSAILALFILAIQFENIFYLSNSFRYFSWVFVFVFLIFLCSYFVSIIIRVKNNTYKSYNFSNLAKKTGELSFTKDDTVINALEIENDKKSTASNQLSKKFIEDVSLKLKKINLSSLFSTKKINKWKKINLTVLALTLALLSITWSHSTASLYRWFHPKTKFLPPKPFKISSKTGNVNLLGGDSTTVIFTAKGEVPDSLLIKFIPIAYHKNEDSIVTKTAKLINGEYLASFNEVLQNYRYKAYYLSSEFWQPWAEISSKEYYISVTDRPSIKDFSVTIIPPKYSRLPPFIQKGNQVEIEALLGSEIKIQLESNILLASANFVLNNIKNEMTIDKKKSSYKFLFEDTGEFYLSISDERGIFNRNPIPFYLKIKKDIDPSIIIIKPTPIVELGGNQIIPIDMIIEDDFGFSKLQLTYEIKRPEYIEDESIISVINISISNPDSTQQNIKTEWDLKSLNLMPDDEVHFHFELYDNDKIKGPKQYVSGKFIARLPSLDNLFESFNQKKDDIAEAVDSELRGIKKLQKQLKKAKLDLLKKDNAERKDQENFKEKMKNIENQLSEFEKITDQLELLNNSGDKHNLFSNELNQKFKDLQKLIEDIIPSEMLRNMDAMNDSLAKLDLKEMLNSIDSLSENLAQVEKDLNRFLDIFKRVKAEQEVDGLKKRLDRLAINQINIDKQIRNISKKTDASVFKRLSKEEDINSKDYNGILKKMNSAVKNIQDISKKTAQSLEKLAESSLAKRTNKELVKTIKNLKNENPFNAMDASYESIQSLDSMKTRMNKILGDFQKETTNDMSKKFRSILRDILTLSKSQETLKQDTENTPQNSPNMRSLAQRQQIIQDQLKKAMQNFIQLSKETFLVSSKMGRKLGVANAQMNTSKVKLSERGIGESIRNQDQAMAALNESAKIIIESISEMRKTGSASGYENFLKEMQSISGQQKNINDQGLQLALGQMSDEIKKSIMQSLLKQQQALNNSLQKMISKDGSKNNNFGDMDGILNEIDLVINDLKQNKFNKETSNRQQKILSRMIDSQKSMTERGEKELRKSQQANQIITSGPQGLPSNLGQRKSITIEAMNNALNAGYSNEYQKMIRNYFNSLAKGIPDNETNSIKIGNDE